MSAKNNQKIGPFLKMARRKAGFSQDDVALPAGPFGSVLNGTKLSRFERYFDKVDMIAPVDSNLFQLRCREFDQTHCAYATELEAPSTFPSITT